MNDDRPKRKRKPKAMKPKPIKLVNAAEMHRQYPDEFEVPSPDEIRALRKGDVVKVCNDRERFWVLIESRNGDVFAGRVDSMLLFGKVRYGDRIEFHADNLYDIFDPTQIKGRPL
jgi:hypothetical protein